MQGFLDLLIGRSVAAAYKAITSGAKGIARYNGHMFLAQQLLGEGLVVHAGGGEGKVDISVFRLLYCI
jgi:hypothetical protein